MTMIGLLSLAAVGCATNTSDKQQVVYHVNTDETKTLNAVLGNIQNHINAVGADKLDLRVVMHGNGLDLLKQAKNDDGMKSKVDKLKMQGVAFNVCANTLKGKKIDYKKDLHDVKEKDIVPSGVAEIAILQGKGFAYVKP
jgi:intracellular sulfur oxidation DsrE/DsrF family protein